MWRIKAGPDVTRFVLSDDSPHFVGWGTGAADEVRQLIRLLESADPKSRSDAAVKLAYLGTTAQPAVPALRQALGDQDPDVRMEVALALLRLGHLEETVGAVKARLRDADPRIRANAALALRVLGPAARSALPDLFEALTDKEPEVRATAAGAVGLIAADGPQRQEAVAVLTALLKSETDRHFRVAAIESLEHIGPQSWTALATVRKGLEESEPPNPLTGPAYDPYSAAVALLLRLDPPPIHLLTDLVEDERTSDDDRRMIIRNLRALGPRARAALPALRRLVQKAPKQGDAFKAWCLAWHDVAGTLLAVDPEGSPTLVVPILLEIARSKEGSFYHHETCHLLGACGTAARPALPALLASLDPEARSGPADARELTPLLRPEDRELLPVVRRLLGKEGYERDLAEALLRLGLRQEALELATRSLKTASRSTRIEVAFWLSRQGPHAESLAPALRQALARAEGGEWAQITLTLRRVVAEPAEDREARALNALDDLLALCAGASPMVGRLNVNAFWPWMPSLERQEHDALGDAIAVVLRQLRANGDPVDVLVRSLRDPSPHVRLVAALALARVEPRHPETIPTLKRLLERQPHFFCFAADTLFALGPLAAPVAPLLLPLPQPWMRIINEEVARTADRLLRRLDPELSWSAVGVPDAVPADLAPLWNDLAAEDAWSADLAAWRLAGAGPKAVAMLRQRFHQPTILTPQRIGRLIGDLDSEEFETRQRASDELRDASEAAPALRQTLAGKPPLEVYRRIEELLAHQMIEERRRLGALRTLEAVGSPEARDLLRSLAQGDPRLTLTQEAAAALGRLERP